MKIPTRGTPSDDKTEKEKKPRKKGNGKEKSPTPEKAESSGRKVPGWVRTLAPILLVLSLPILAITMSFLTGNDTLGSAPYARAASGFIAHPGLAALVLIPLIAAITHITKSRSRVNPPARKGKPRKRPQPPLRPARSIARDAADIALFLDSRTQRLVHGGLFFAALITPELASFSLAQWKHPTTGLLRPALISLAGPALYYGWARFHIGPILKERSHAVQQIWQIARDYLRYPKRLAAQATKAEMVLQTPELAVNVSRWKSLTEVDTAFVTVPSDVSVTEEKPWDEFGTNLNARLPREEEWRVRRDPRGTGATIEAANYPTGVLWDGECDPDPLTFNLGTNLDTGEMQSLTLGEVSPHLLITGGTSSGKTSGAEIIAAQVLTTPMPWDAALFGIVHLIDPKGTLARRWRGRRGVVTSEGTADHYSEIDAETGEPLGGIEVMMLHLQAIEEERLRRDKILAKYPDVGTWVHLPHEVLRAERFVPVLVILDEYLDHTDKINGTSARVQRENEARAKIQEIATMHARKYRNVGMHTALIAQEGKMTVIGSSLVRQLAVRCVTGQMDATQLGSMFGQDREIPSLPSTRVVNGKVKTVPGRARIMNAGGQDINRVQIMWFGGSTNSETLDKYLPRGEEPPNGDFTPAQGGVGATVSRELPTHDATLSPSAIESDNDESDGSLIEPGTGMVDEGATPASMMMTGTPATLGETTPQADGEGFDDYTGTGYDYDTTPETSTQPDPNVTFPAAQALPLCGEEGCANDATETCGIGNEPRCAAHLYAPIEGDKTVCSGCYWSHPVAQAGLATVWATMSGYAALDPTILLSWAPNPDGSVTAVASRAGGRKMMQVTGAPGQPLIGRSKTGAVDGEPAVIDRINDVLGQAPQPTQQELFNDPNQQ